MRPTEASAAATRPHQAPTRRRPAPRPRIGSDGRGQRPGLAQRSEGRGGKSGLAVERLGAGRDRRQRLVERGSPSDAAASAPLPSSIDSRQLPGAGRDGRRLAVRRRPPASSSSPGQRRVSAQPSRRAPGPSPSCMSTTSPSRSPPCAVERGPNIRARRVAAPVVAVEVPAPEARPCSAASRRASPSVSTPQGARQAAGAPRPSRAAARPVSASAASSASLSSEWRTCS